MKRHLTIAIDANRVTCGKCEHRSPFAASLPQLPACTLFMQPLYATTDWQPLRPMPRSRTGGGGVKRARLR